MLADNGVESRVDLVGLQVRSAGFKLGGLPEVKVGFLVRATEAATREAERDTAAKEATLRAEREAALPARHHTADEDGSSAAASASGLDPVSALVQALQGGRKPKPRVNVSEKLKGLSLETLPSSCWPSPQLVDWLEAKVRADKDKGISKPFVYVELSKFLPHWAADKRGSGAATALGEAPTLAQAIARGLSESKEEKDKKGDLLSILPWSAAYDRWALAASFTDQITLAAAMAHKDVVMQIAMAARGLHKTTAIAVLYDEVTRREWATLAAGLGSFDASQAAGVQDPSYYIRAEREYTSRGFPTITPDRPSHTDRPREKGSGKDKGGKGSKGKGGKDKFGKGKRDAQSKQYGWWQQHGSAYGGDDGAERGVQTPQRKRTKTD